VYVGQAVGYHRSLRWVSWLGGREVCCLCIPSVLNLACRAEFILGRQCATMYCSVISSVVLCSRVWAVLGLQPIEAWLSGLRDAWQVPNWQ
jgi:hypothetical protein